MMKEWYGQRSELARRQERLRGLLREIVAGLEPRVVAYKPDPLTHEHPAKIYVATDLVRIESVTERRVDLSVNLTEDRIDVSPSILCPNGMLLLSICGNALTLGQWVALLNVASSPITTLDDLEPEVFHIGLERYLFDLA